MQLILDLFKLVSVRSSATRHSSGTGSIYRTTPRTQSLESTFQLKNTYVHWIHDSKLTVVAAVSACKTSFIKYTYIIVWPRNVIEQKKVTLMGFIFLFFNSNGFLTWVKYIYVWFCYVCHGCLREKHVRLRGKTLRNVKSVTCHCLL